MFSKKTDYSPSRTPVPGNAPSHPSHQTDASRPKPVEGMIDLLVRKLAHGMLFDCPIISPWEGMLRRTSSGTSSPGMPTSTTARSQSITRLASMFAFDGHPEMAADLGRSRSLPTKP